jgi:hypothetical protein
VNQYHDIENEMKTGDGSPEDFYLTHPISPMRVMALDLFYRSETYCKSFAPHLTPGAHRTGDGEPDRRLYEAHGTVVPLG